MQYCNLAAIHPPLLPLKTITRVVGVIRAPLKNSSTILERRPGIEYVFRCEAFAFWRAIRYIRHRGGCKDVGPKRQNRGTHSCRCDSCADSLPCPLDAGSVRRNHGASGTSELPSHSSQCPRIWHARAGELRT